MRKAGLVVAAALQATAAAVKAGTTTSELDAVAGEVIRTSGATSSFLGYQGYPAVTCISVNSEIVHGIPGSRVLARGRQRVHRLRGRSSTAGTATPRSRCRSAPAPRRPGR